MTRDVRVLVLTAIARKFLMHLGADAHSFGSMQRQDLAMNSDMPCHDLQNGRHHDLDDLGGGGDLKEDAEDTEDTEDTEDASLATLKFATRWAGNGVARLADPTCPGLGTGLPDWRALLAPGWERGCQTGEPDLPRAGDGAATLADQTCTVLWESFHGRRSCWHNCWRSCC